MSGDHWIGSIERRTFLQTGAVVAGGILVPNTVGADQHTPDPANPPKPTNHDVHWGESSDRGGVWTYATTDDGGNLSSLGVHIDGETLAGFGDDEVAAHLHFPEETADGDDVDLHQFTFTGFHYNPAGHPPPEIYTVPHIDFHFYMMAEDDVQNISGGPLGEAPLPFIGLADYDLPEAQLPEGYMFEEHRFIVKEMGEHLLDATAPEFQDEAFTHTYVYGVYDPSIDPGNPDRIETLQLQGECVDLPVYGSDGEGKIHFVEPMVTTDFLRNDLAEEVAVDVATPEVFAEEDEYPTEYVMKPDGDGGVYVSIDGFEEFPGASSSMTLGGSSVQLDQHRSHTGLRDLRF